MNILLKSDVGAAMGGVLILLVVLALAALWIWALVDAIRVPDDADYRAGTKLVWVLVIVLTGFIGAAVYLAVGRPARRPAPQ
jgi:UDP-N-acetylmuramyl pentapeptide phosphotransferase/UDP-N-acetylglucosamine-1-phosphate transferase